MAKRSNGARAIWNAHTLYSLSLLFLQLWDLRSSTSSPLCELAGHTKGILSVDWCPWDQRLVMSSGKDGHTFIWDITQGKAIAEVSSGETIRL
jgi:protein transport protein SEC31